MKKIPVLILVLLSLLLIGCTRSSLIVDDPEPITTGNILLTVSHTGSLLDGEIKPQLVPIQATNVRVYIRGGIFFRTYLRDVVIPQTGETVLALELPIGTYQIHAIAYKKDSDGKGNHYGTALTGKRETNIVVQETETTTVNINLEKFDMNVSVSPEAKEGYMEEGVQYRITYNNITTNNLLSGTGYVQLLYSRLPWTGDTFNITSDVARTTFSSRNVYLNAPEELDTKVYHQIRFPLSDDYTGEFSPLYFYWPSTTYGDELFTIKTRPTGDINIGIQ
jgi:hypothetical protein